MGGSGSRLSKELLAEYQVRAAPGAGPRGALGGAVPGRAAGQGGRGLRAAR